jgi:hypothetical protein
MGMNESGLKELAASLKYSMAKLMKELESQVEEAQRMHSQADDAEDPDAELETRIYRDVIQSLQEEVRDTQHYAKYLLSDIDAAGELILNKRGRFELLLAGSYNEVWEFSCGNSIEVWDEQNRRWMYGSVEYSDSYPHGYYFKQARMALQPGMIARHRYINPWDD